jgi:UDP-N-acetyl-D-mannosaminuronic acid transferase (WecB/TagA/CpsF family)
MATRQLSDGDTDGTTLGQSATDLIGFYGGTPVAQRSGADQTAVSTTVGGAVATTAATATSPFGYTTAAQADAIVANVNALRADVLALAALTNELRAGIVALGLVKGSA